MVILLSCYFGLFPKQENNRLLPTDLDGLGKVLVNSATSSGEQRRAWTKTPSTITYDKFRTIGIKR